MNILAYERIVGKDLHNHFVLFNDQSLLVRQPFRWLKNGAPISHAYEAVSMESLCEEHNWQIVERYGEHIAIIENKS